MDKAKTSISSSLSIAPAIDIDIDIYIDIGIDFDFDIDFDHTVQTYLPAPWQTLAQPSKQQSALFLNKIFLLFIFGKIVFIFFWDRKCGVSWWW